MRLLIDTSIVLEVILEQSKAEEAQTLLGKTEEHEFFLSDYSLHSIGILLFRRKQFLVFWQFLSDMIINAGMEVTSLPVENLRSVVEVAQRCNLDFDDAYQAEVAEKYNFTIVSFDSDFDRTARGRKAPAEILGG